MKVTDVEVKRRNGTVCLATLRMTRMGNRVAVAIVDNSTQVRVVFPTAHICRFTCSVFTPAMVALVDVSCCG